jgi:hypothetical protein
MDGFIWIKRGKHSPEMSFIAKQTQRTKEILSASIRFITKQRRHSGLNKNKEKKLIMYYPHSIFESRKPVMKRKKSRAKTLQLYRV